MRFSAIQKTDASRIQDPSTLRAQTSSPSKRDDIADSDIKPELLRPPVLFGCIAPLRELYPLTHHQADFDQLQANGVLEPPTTLNSLIEGEVAEYPPPHTVTTIVKCAILGSPRQRLTLKELRIALRRRFHYYANTDSRSWCNTIRYYLSTDEDFVKVPRQRTIGDTGAWWTVRDVAIPPNPMPFSRASKKLVNPNLQNRGKSKEAQERRCPPPGDTHPPCNSSSATGGIEASELHIKSGHDQTISEVYTNPPVSPCHRPYPQLHPQLHPPHPPHSSHPPHPPHSPQLSPLPPLSYCHPSLSQPVPSSEKSHNSLPGIRDLGLLDFGRDSIRSVPSD